MKIAFAADLVAYACFLLVGLALYALFKDVHRIAAVAMLTMNAVSVAIQSLNLVNHAGAVLAAQRGADELAVLFLDLHGVGYLIAQVFFGGWLIPLGYLVVRSGMVPRLFGYALMVGGVGYLLGPRRRAGRARRGRRRAGPGPAGRDLRDRVPAVAAGAGRPHGRCPRPSVAMCPTPR